MRSFIIWRWAGRVAWMGEVRYAYKILFGNPEGN
jgi:hypothetical protein